MVTSHRFVEVGGPRIVEWIGQLHHPVMRIRLKHLKGCRILGLGKSTRQARAQFVLPASLCSANLLVIALHKLGFLGENRTVGRAGFKWETRRHHGFKIVLSQVPAVDGNHVHGHQGCRAQHHPPRLKPGLDQGQQCQQGKGRQAHGAQYIGPKKLDPQANCPVPHLFHGHVRPKGTLEIKPKLRCNVKKHHQEDRSSSSKCPALPLLLRLGLTRFVQCHGRTKWHHQLHEHQHHFGVSELVKQRKVVEEHIGQSTCITPRKHNRQKRHQKCGEPQPVAAHQPPCKAQSEGQRSKVKCPTTEPLFPPIQGIVSSLHIGNGKAPKFTAGHAVFQNVVP